MCVAARGVGINEKVISRQRTGNDCAGAVAASEHGEARRRRFFWESLPMLTRQSFWTTFLSLAATSAAAGAAMAADSARLAAYRQDGQTSYALSLSADMPKKEVDAVDVVVLFDTSASQQGAYRETAIESLKALLAGLRTTDRVQVVAVDLNARPLTKDFAAA